MRYCMECGNYIPGGGEPNCSFPFPPREFSKKYVCALKEACEYFIEKDDEEEV